MFAFKNMAGSTAATEVEVEHDGLALAVHESFVEIEEVNGLLPVAMSNVYEMWAMDDTRPMDQKKAVMEGVIGDAGEKIKNFFKKLAEKIKAWWKSVVKYFRSIFSSNEAFLDKYEDELKNKASDANDFKYEGHEWKVDKADEMLNKAIGYAEKYKLSPNGGNLNLKDEKKAIDTALGAKSPSDFCTKLREAAGGKRTKTIRGFSAVSVDTMIDCLRESGNKAVEDLEERASDLSSLLEKKGDDIDDAIKAAKDDSKAVGDQRVILGATKYAVSYATQAISAAKKLYSEAMSEYSGVLRSLLRFTTKAEKEEKKRVSESAGLLSVWGGEF